MSVRLLLLLGKTKLPLTSPQRMILECIAYYTNDDKKDCWPSYRIISDFCCLTKCNVIKNIERLRLLNFIIVNKITNEDGNYTNNHYELNENIINSYLNRRGGWYRSDTTLVSERYHPSIGAIPHISINNLINDLKENKQKKNPAPAVEHPNSVLRSNAKRVIDFLRLKTGRNYRYVDTTLKPIIHRLREGITVEQCKQVIARKQMEWGHKPEMEKYLRPSTLFSKSNFYDKYLPELVTTEEKKKIMKID
jgi:uncharacterized phage protein (TIGR02220 family)